MNTHRISLMSLLEQDPGTFYHTDKITLSAEWKNRIRKYNCPQYHSYIENFYDHEFSKYVNNSSVQVCEIGIERGGSIALWSKYFEKNGTILGIDVSSDRVLPEYQSGNFSNVTHVISDAYDPAFVESLSNFDIIIDDGPHTLQSQIDFIKLYLEKLNPGGVMIVEDVAHINWIRPLQELVPENYTTEIVDLREADNRYDSLLFVIRKPETA